MNIEKLREYFEVLDGALVRLKTVHYNAKAGDVAGTVDRTTGYLKVNFDGKVRLAHRLVWELERGPAPEMIDHIDGDRTNNRIENLRAVDNSMNMQNLKRARADSSTGLLGVSRCKTTGKYCARIRAGGKYLSLGRFDDQQAASAAYIAAKRRLHAGCTI